MQTAQRLREVSKGPSEVVKNQSQVVFLPLVFAFLSIAAVNHLRIMCYNMVVNCLTVFHVLVGYEFAKIRQLNQDKYSMYTKATIHGRWTMYSAFQRTTLGVRLRVCIYELNGAAN